MTEFLSFLDRPNLFIACAILSTLAYFVLGSSFYNGTEDFLDALRLFFQPDWLSALRGEWGDDQWQTIKLMVFLGCCAGIATAAYKGAKLFF